MGLIPRWVWLAMVAPAIAGCNAAPSDGLPREPVSGAVTIDGKPLDAGSIIFVPSGFEGPPVGAPVKAGTYSLARPDGPIPGKHQVSVYSPKRTGKTIPDPSDPAVMLEESLQTIPPKYNLKSELKADITKGGPNHFDFDLTGEIKTPPPLKR